MGMWRSNRRLYAGGLLSLVFAMHLFVLPAVARAQTTTVEDIPRKTEFAINEARGAVKVSLIGSMFSGLVNLLTFAANRLAYDAAVMLASGGNADEPLIEYRSPGDYFTDYGAAVAGEAVGLLSEELAVAGGLLSNFNLCSPSTPEVLLSFQLGIRAAFERPEPSCDFNQIKDNWSGFIAEISSDVEGGIFRNELILSELVDAFDPQTNELSVGISLYTDIIGKSRLEAAIAKDKLITQGPVKDVTDFITGNVATPASLINHDVENSMLWSKNVGNQILLTTLSNTDALLQVGLSAASVFTNTLLSQLTNKLYTGLFDFDEVDFNPFDEGFSTSSDREAAQRRFRSLLTVTPLEVADYDILSQFSACPTSGRGLYNCVADSTFISAVARAETGAPLTLAEAIEDDYVDADWPLIPSEDTARDQDPYCYTYGFCHSNLVKLRKARVIPIGWELAAESSANSADDPVTLQEVIDGFSSCNDDGERDDNHPWCKLVDPNWVLKYPETQCRALVYGQLLETSSVDTRKQECVDMPSCIAEDEDGTCTGGYGYCVREANIWRFRGDSCPEYAASCLTFEASDGSNESFIRNSVDYSVCDEGNAGCLWYATTKVDDDDDGAYAWPTLDDVATTDAATGTYEDRIYFTSAVEECDDDEGGCTELVPREDDLALNMLPNPSFETDDDSDDVPDNWLLTYAASDTAYDTENSYGRTGKVALFPGSGLVYQEGIVLAQTATYTLSYYAKQATDGATEAAQMLIALIEEDGTAVDLTGTAYGDSCTLSGTDSNALEVNGTPESTDYERFTCTFYVPSLSDSAANVIAFVDVMAGDVWVDDIQLEQADEVSDFAEGYSTDDVDAVYAKAPPAYLGCTGDEDTDPEDCANYAGVCSETDVGCSAYDPENGDPTVFGVASALDECPSSCSGYDSFKQEATLYEPEGDFPVYLIPSSAETCSEEEVGCDEFTNLSDESLDYFTYLRACLTSSQAEANSNGDNAATYYTWEGSDLAGYQLVTWTLLESDMDGSTSYTYAYDDSDGNAVTETNPGSAPCTSWTAGEEGITCNDDADGDNTFDRDAEDCNEHDDIFTNPDCREFYDDDGYIHYRDWSYTVTVDDACATYRKTTLVGYGDDDDGDGTDDGQANCENSGGYFDDTLGQCRYFGYSSESTTCSESGNGCREYTGGRSGNSRVVIEETFESDDLTDWDAAYGADVEYSNESVATDGHSLASTGATVWSFLYDHGGACAETTEGEGCAGTAQQLGGECSVYDGEQYCGTLEDEFYAGKTYTVSFWAKGSGTLTVGFDIAATPASGVASEVDFGTVTLSETSWEEVTLGPLDMNEDDYAAFGNGTVIVFEPGSSSTLFYVDNIVIREGEENITLIKDSWVTPAECDETPTGASSPQYYLGCQEYSDEDGETVYLKSFSSLCDEDKVGCEDYFATHESDSPYAEVYNVTCATLDGAIVTSGTDCYYGESSGAYDTDSAFLCTISVGESTCSADLDWYVPEAELPAHITYGPSAHIVPADSPVYLIIDDEDECDSDVAGCMELGEPVFSQDRSQVAESESVYLINDPDEYDDILCPHNALFCDAWESDDDGTFYFKDPGDQTCEYTTDVTVGGTTYDGWFRTGTSEFCYGTGTCAESGASCTTDADCGADDSCSIDSGSYVIGGDQSGLWLNGDDDYSGWVGTCDDDYSGCAEFQDLLDIDEDEFYGEADGASYYYIDNDTLEDSTLASSQQCDGQVSQKYGCGLFYETTETSLTASASATYIASTHADAFFGDTPYALIDPIDCDASDTSLELTDGTTVDLCAQRCAYANVDLYDLGTDYEDEYTYGGSCYTDNDCGDYLSEGGYSVEGSCASSDDVPRLENDSNRVLKVNRDRECSEWLSCSDTQTVWDENSSSYKTICGDVSLCNEYSADGNASFCSSWSSDSVAIVTDIDAYSARDVSWYGDEYSGYAIPDTFPVELLSQSVVSPPPGYCDTTDTTLGIYSAYHGDECEDDGDCGEGTCVLTDEQEYALVFNAGTCDGSYGASCTVGYCANTGEACSYDDECGTDGGDCLTGECRYYDTSESGSCTSDAECADNGSYTTCLSGTCGYARGNAPVDDPSTTGDDAAIFAATCAGNGGVVAYSALTKLGTCVREQCLLNAAGDAIDIDDPNAKTCRGYPESNSPFDNEIVEEWRDPWQGSIALPTRFTSDLATYADNIPYLQPYDYVTGFENVQTCAAGEDCVCSYKKVTYGSLETVYYGLDSDYPDQEIGICVGGGYDSMWCSTSGTDVNLDEDGETEGDGDDIQIILEDTCENGSTYAGGGTCQYPEQEDTVRGLDGYCLERDTAIATNGNRDEDHRACLTWLPVDQLSGSTDLYAQYINAGYNGGETQYCSYISEYANVRSSEVDPDLPRDMVLDGAAREDTPIACIEYDSGASSTMEGCLNDWFYCPIGFYGIVGAPYSGSEDDNYADVCRDNGADDNCPFECVPFDSYNTDGACTEPTSGYDAATSISTSFDDSDGNAYTYDTPVYYYTDASEFDTAVNARVNCWAYGRQALTTYNRAGGTSANALDASYNPNEEMHNCPDATDQCGFYNYFDGSTEKDYLGCRDLVEVDDEEGVLAAAWTDRLLNQNADGSTNGYAIDTYDSYDPDGDFAYTWNTGVWPYGASITPSAAEQRDNSDAYPAIVGACTDPTSETYSTPTMSDDGATFTCDDGVNDFVEDINAPEARAFIDFSGGWGDEYMSYSAVNEQATSDATLTSAAGLIEQLFARSIGLWRFSDGVLDRDAHTVAATGATASVGSYDDVSAETDYTASVEWDVRADDVNPPTVWELDLDNCEGDQCKEGEAGKLTLNSANEGEQTGTDFFRAYLKFYAAADKNHLPIRRVIVDWQDDTATGTAQTDQTGSSSQDNFYKNHRGLQDDSDVSICETDTDSASYEWGMNSDSCDPNYFSYSYIYTCTEANINTLTVAGRTCERDDEGNITNSPCTDGTSCYFRPRVHIRDNWGWCTGTCSGSTYEEDGTTSCFEGTSTSDIFATSSEESECAYQTYPELSSANDPWVYYDGEIVVTP